MTDKEQRRQLWAARIADFRASGLTMSAWCTANQCSIDQLKYWLYKAKDKLPSPSTNSSLRWVPLEAIDSQPVAPVSSSLVVWIGQARIELHPGFNPQLLREIVQVLGEPSC